MGRRLKVTFADVKSYERHTSRFMCGNGMVDAKIRAKTQISPEESLSALLRGVVRSREKIAKITDGRELTRDDRINALFFLCSDSRETGFWDAPFFLEHRIILFPLAGNIYSSELKDEVSALLKKMSPEGTAIFLGHENCGFVRAVPQRDGLAGSEKNGNIHRLLLEGTLPSTSISNATHQSSKFMADFPATLCNTVLMDWDNPEVFADLGGSPANAGGYIQMFNKLFGRKAFNTASLATQYAHAVVVFNSEDLGIVADPRVLFDAGPNEVFIVHGNPNGLSQLSMGSIDYATGHVHGVSQIVLLGSNKDFLDTWMTDLLVRSQIVARALVSGKAQLTQVLCNPETMETVPLRSLKADQYAP